MSTQSIDVGGCTFIIRYGEGADPRLELAIKAAGVSEIVMLVTKAGLSDLAQMLTSAGEPEPDYSSPLKRETFAAMAMQGLLAGPYRSMDSLAQDAVEFADLLLTKLSKKRERVEIRFLDAQLQLLYRCRVSPEKLGDTDRDEINNGGSIKIPPGTVEIEVRRGR